MARVATVALIVVLGLDVICVHAAGPLPPATPTVPAMLPAPQPSPMPLPPYPPGPLPWPMFPPWVAPIDAARLYPDVPPRATGSGAPAIPPPSTVAVLWNGLEAGMAPRAVKARFADAQVVPPARNAPGGTITLRTTTALFGADFDVNCNFQRDALVNVSLYAANPADPGTVFGRLGDALAAKYGPAASVGTDPNASLAAPVYEDTAWQVGRVRTQAARWQVGRTTITLLRAGSAIHLIYDTGLASATDRL